MEPVGSLKGGPKERVLGSLLEARRRATGYSLQAARWQYKGTMKGALQRDYTERIGSL